MILLETNPKDFFQDRLAILEVEDNYITLTFEVPFNKGRNKFTKGGSISKEYFNSSELSYMKKELKIKVLPYEIFNEYVLEDVYNFLRTL